MRDLASVWKEKDSVSDLHMHVTTYMGTYMHTSHTYMTRNVQNKLSGMAHDNHLMTRDYYAS